MIKDKKILEEKSYSKTSKKTQTFGIYSKEGKFDITIDPSSGKTIKIIRDEIKNPHSEEVEEKQQRIDEREKDKGFEKNVYSFIISKKKKYLKMVVIFNKGMTKQQEYRQTFEREFYNSLTEQEKMRYDSFDSKSQEMYRQHKANLKHIDEKGKKIIELFDKNIATIRRMNSRLV